MALLLYYKIDSVLNMYSQGGLPNERLSSLSIEGVCNMLHRLEGLNSLQLAAYQSRIQENNITGLVLMTCDITELKSVMAMSFGDWELFKRLLQMLRDRDEATSSTPASASSNETLENIPESKPSPETFTKEFVTTRGDALGDTTSGGDGSGGVEKPKPVYPSGDRRSSSGSDTGQELMSKPGEAV